MGKIFSDKVLEAAREHAREKYPEESCGIVARGKYIKVLNSAEDPSTHVEGNPNCNCRLCSFVISPKAANKYLYTCEGVIHSHPNGNAYPSKADMAGQIQMDIPWAIIPLDEEREYEAIEWGGDYIPPIIGREFVHGVTDCCSIIRDVFRLGKDKLAEQDISWPFDPIPFEECAREDGWWANGENLYEDNIKGHGFVEIKSHEARPGDVFLLKIRSQITNHGGVLLEDNLILHHLPNRVSRREVAGAWGAHAHIWLRYVGKENVDA